MIKYFTNPCIYFHISRYIKDYEFNSHISKKSKLLKSHIIKEPLDFWDILSEPSGICTKMVDFGGVYCNGFEDGKKAVRIRLVFYRGVF